MAIKVYQVEISDAMADEVNAAGCWSKVAWSKTYLDLTMGSFSNSDNVSVMEMILEAIEFGLVGHTMTLDTNNLNEAFDLGNGYGDMTKVVEHQPHKSMSVGDILVDTETGAGAVVARFGFENLTAEEVAEIEKLVA